MQAAGYPAMNAAAPALLRSFDWKWVVIGLCVVFTIYIAVVPLAFLLWQSFFTPQTAAKAAEFTLGNYTSAYGSSETLRLFWNSVQFAVGASVFAFVLGTALAWMNERTNTPFKTLFFALSIIPLIIPGILFTVAWILLGSPKIGIINLALQNWFGLEWPLFNVYSLWGMIWVDGLHYSPMAFLLMTAAFRAMDPALEESATMSGANIFQVAYRVTLKLTWPAILATLLMLFVRAIESFEVPALLGLPVGIHVFTSAIYQAVHRYPSQIGLASAYGMTLLVITTIGVYFVSRLSSRGSKYATMTGKGFRPRRIDLGPWRWFAAAIFIVYFLLIVVLPFAVLLWSSFQRFYSVPSWQALHNLTLDPYRFIFTYPNLVRSVWNTLILSFGSATLIMLVTSVICWIVVKTKLPGRWLLDNVASLPMVFPGLVLGLSIMSLHHPLHAVRAALQHDLDAADPQGARGIGGDERRLLGHHVSPRYPAPAQARARRGLDLRDDRLDPRALQLDPALQPRHRSPVDHHLGIVGERPVRGAVGARRAVHPRALRPGDARPVAGQEIRSRGVIRRTAC